jgi:hypothetical protein
MFAYLEMINWIYYSSLQQGLGRDQFEAKFSELKETSLSLIKIEETFLFPEFGSLFSGSDTYLASAKVCHAAIAASLSEMESSLRRNGHGSKEVGGALELLARALMEYIGSQQEVFMPKIRKMVPTGDREELGQVFLDVRQDAVAGL